jgi:hypothetical protein
MDALTNTQTELIEFLQNNQFDHLSQKEQSRLRDYLRQILNTLEYAVERRTRARQVA